MSDSALPTQARPTAALPRQEAPPRFLPGQILAGRYRVVAPLGRGGMGEVYRADDTKLGQPVALKFLPAPLSQDLDRRRRLLDEVRLARRVAHPHVCQVWDVGEVDGHDFLAMEYVDGENLAALLGRIGRLPEDRALRMARELCAGLAAAHEQGVLHRDLKPANVMVDGRGHVKLADFGLAAAVEDAEKADVRSGTPAYMSPEQLEGTAVSVRSDVYALGLVLYELFTGQPAYPERTLAEASDRTTPPSRASSRVGGLDPAIDRAIESCLEPDPARRPPTATAVAALLPGGDPLAAALAAGETPSPEMVAAAGPRGGLSPAAAIGSLAAFVVLWFTTAVIGRAINPFDHLPFVKSYEALQENAREIARRIGYPDTPAHSWAGFGFVFPEYFHLVRESGPASLGAHLGQPAQPVFLLGYRQHDRPITPVALDGRVGWSSPAPNPGDVSIAVDLRGRLVALRVTPPSLAPVGAVAREPDWAALFEAAGLDIARFEPTTPTLRPESFADVRRAWRGTLPDYLDRPVRIEAAALDGRPIAFQGIISSDPRWAPAAPAPPPPPRGAFTAAAVLFLTVLLATLFGSLLLAVRNLKEGRGDRRGAFRLAGFVFTLRSLHWAFAGDHAPHPDLLGPLAVAFSGATALALLTWIAYVAGEPYVRRLWPETLVSWTRVLGGRFRDPLVGRDVLAGCTFHAAQGLLLVSAFWAAQKAGIAGVIPLEDSSIVLRGGRFAVGELFGVTLVSTVAALSLMMIVLLLRMACRRTWIAGTVFCLLWGALFGLQLAGLWGPRAGLFGIVLQMVPAAVYLVVLLRFGFLALLAAFVVGGLSRLGVPILDAGSPLFGIGLLIATVAFTIAAYGCWTALAGRPPARPALTGG